MTQEFDIFLAYNSGDKDAARQVRVVGNALKESGLHVSSGTPRRGGISFDGEDSDQGTPSSISWSSAVESSRCVAIFRGKKGLAVDERLAITGAVEYHRRVIAVLLPGSDDVHSLPGVKLQDPVLDLREKFSGGTLSDTALTELLAAVRGAGKEEHPLAEASSVARDSDRLVDQVEWVPDAPETQDSLGREGLAKALSDRVRRLRGEEPGKSFLVHIDGPWGSGKTTLLELVTQRLGGEFLLVRFDAWRQSRVGPPWWSLLTSLRNALAAEAGFVGRLSLRVGEARERLRRAGMPYLVGLVTLIAVVSGLVFLFDPQVQPEAIGEFARSLAAVLAAIGTLWVGTKLLGKLLFWDSAIGARLYEESHESPMESLADHFAWLVVRAHRPVIFVVDDLDRCDNAYVVDLLDAIQTLIRDVPRRQQPLTGGALVAPYFLVAADGAWIRRSYEVRHEAFREIVEVPGRTLGYLFLDKIFQLTLEIPSLSPRAQNSYLERLLRAKTSSSEDLERLAATTEDRINRSTAENEVIEALQAVGPEVRARVAGSALDRLSQPEIESATEHELQKFAPLLEPNPRAMKRFVNAYGMARASGVVADSVLPRDPLALWTILRHRWPSFAKHLCSNPEAIDTIARGGGAPEGVPEEIAPLYKDPSVTSVVTFPRGGPLTREHIGLWCGAGEAPQPGARAAGRR